MGLIAVSKHHWSSVPRVRRFSLKGQVANILDFEACTACCNIHLSCCNTKHQYTICKQIKLSPNRLWVISDHGLWFADPCFILRKNNKQLRVTDRQVVAFEERSFLSFFSPVAKGRKLSTKVGTQGCGRINLKTAKRPSQPKSLSQILVIFFSFLPSFLSFFLPFLGPLPATYGGSQARSLIGAVATSLCQSHSSAGSEPRLQPIPQLTAMPDPYPLSKARDRTCGLMVPSRIRQPLCHDGNSCWFSSWQFASRFTFLSFSFFFEVWHASEKSQLYSWVYFTELALHNQYPDQITEQDHHQKSPCALSPSLLLLRDCCSFLLWLWGRSPYSS